MSGPAVLMLASAAVVGLLGALHLLYTFSGDKLLPRDPALVERMKAVSLVITPETSVWKAWIGFNASHSLCAILFGLVYGYLGAVQPQLLFGSPFLLACGLGLLVALTGLAYQYWFRVPLAGVSLATLLYVLALLGSQIGRG